MNRRLLRTIGIAIIIFPDPTFISDVIGLLLVAASYLLFRKKTLSYKKLNGLVLYHLGCMKDEKSRNCQVEQHGLKWNPKYVRNITSSDSDEIWQRGIATGQIVHHTLDRRRLEGNYKIVGKFSPEKQRYYWHGECETGKVVYHTLNRGLLLNRSKEVCPVHAQNPVSTLLLAKMTS